MNIFIYLATSSIDHFETFALRILEIWVKFFRLRTKLNNHVTISHDFV